MTGGIVDARTTALEVRVAVLEARNAELEAQVTWLRERAVEEWVSPETYGREHEHPVGTIRKWIETGIIAPSDVQKGRHSVRVRRNAVPRSEATPPPKQIVTHAELLSPRNGGRACRYKLTLQCGHSVEVTSPARTEPKKAKCDECAGANTRRSRIVRAVGVGGRL